MTTPDLDLSLFGADHVRRYRETGGEVGYLWNGAPSLILTTTGRKSGMPRDTPLICTADSGNGNRHVVIASQGGAPTHPHWYLNLRADPRVRVQVKADCFEAVACIAEGTERERLWRLAVAIWPRFDLYRTRTDRIIPVVVLERTGIDAD